MWKTNKGPFIKQRDPKFQLLDMLASEDNPRVLQTGELKKALNGIRQRCHKPRIAKAIFQYSRGKSRKLWDLQGSVQGSNTVSSCLAL